MSSEESSRKVSRRIPLWALVCILVLLGLALFGDKGVLRAIQANRRKADLETRVRQLEAANAKLRKTIEALRNDPRTIENLAREELGMVKPDELVYQFRSPRKPSPARDNRPPKDR